MRNPERAFAAFIVLHVLLWTLVPSILIGNPPLDVIEGVAYGREWQLAYWKHPPLPWWINALVREIAGPRVWPFFLLGQLSIALCFWAIWRLAREFLGPLEALLAVILLDGCIVFNVLGKEFNHNSVQLPIWALAGWIGYLAFTRGRTLHWVLLGICFALAIHGKYSAVTLIASLFLFSIINATARRCWKTVGPYFAMVIFAILIAPHLASTISHGYDPREWSAGRAPQAGSFTQHISGILNLLVNAVLQVAPCIGLFALLQGKVWQKPDTAVPDRKFAYHYFAVLALGPFLLTVLAALVSGRVVRSGWLQQFWPFVGLFLVMTWTARVERPSFHRLTFGWIVLTVLLVVSQVMSQWFYVGGGSLTPTQFPGRKLTEAVTSLWRQETGQPLRYVVGDYWPGGNVVFFSPDRLQLFSEGSLRKSPWIDPSDLRRRGAILLWDAGRGDALRVPDQLQAHVPPVATIGSVSLNKQTLVGERSWRVGYAIVRPSLGSAAAPDGSGELDRR